MGEIIFIAILAVIGLITFFTTQGYEVLALDESGGPGIFPSAVGLILFVLCVALLAQLIYNKYHKKQETKPFGFKEFFIGVRGIFVAISILFVVAVQFIGFLWPSIVYVNALVVLMVYFKNKNLGKNVKTIIIRTVFVTLGVVACYFFFTSALGIRLG